MKKSEPQKAFEGIAMITEMGFLHDDTGPQKSVTVSLEENKMRPVILPKHSLTHTNK